VGGERILGPLRLAEAVAASGQSYKESAQPY
jgi:hypothetical protein